jgi:hypothetical protein
MVTPEWAKRKWPHNGGGQQTDGVQGPAVAPFTVQEEDVPTAGRPLYRGNVARRLNIDEARITHWLPFLQCPPSEPGACGCNRDRHLVLRRPERLTMAERERGGIDVGWLGQALRGRAAKVAGQSPGQSASPGMARRHVLMAEASSAPTPGAADSDMCRSAPAD